ncbi:hypothetical protein mgb1_041 [Bacillus phage MG-B1]|uniref:Uncharacterized protein n=1 Tax=Bacillus phage MG-B1 TaxID=1309583 RepID=M4W6P0_9CAUD|nr:hypothetical protein mgb1_041 [Bacillus phage MG-B1]AGI10630.1 hypothetical protein mgb1_041 [Bacillus phage MG-B1]
MNNFNNNFENNNDFLVAGQLGKQNQLKQQELSEQQAMRKAYCKVNNIPYEEPEEIPGLSQGSLKVLCFTVWLFIIGTVISSFIGEGNFLTNFMKVWF